MPTHGPLGNPHNLPVAPRRKRTAPGVAKPVRRPVRRPVRQPVRRKY